MFEKQDQNIGSVKPGGKKVIEFPFTNINSIDEVKVPCSCTVADVNRVENKIKITFIAQDIPPHLIGQGWYVAVKKVTVKYTTLTAPTVPEITILSFTVTVKA